jgi:hypothetical protein
LCSQAGGEFCASYIQELPGGTWWVVLASSINIHYYIDTLTVIHTVLLINSISHSCYCPVCSPAPQCASHALLHTILSIGLIDPEYAGGEVSALLSGDTPLTPLVMENMAKVFSALHAVAAAKAWPKIPLEWHDFLNVLVRKATCLLDARQPPVGDLILTTVTCVFQSMSIISL